VPPSKTPVSNSASRERTLLIRRPVTGLLHKLQASTDSLKMRYQLCYAQERFGNGRNCFHILRGNNTFFIRAGMITFGCAVSKFDNFQVQQDGAHNIRQCFAERFIARKTPYQIRTFQSHSISQSITTQPFSKTQGVTGSITHKFSDCSQMLGWFIWTYINWWLS
jgi:hypothetical protein